MRYNAQLSEYINRNYNKLVSLLRNEWRKMKNTQSFNEDIFHDTLMKCMERFNDEEFDENIFRAYLVSSFKTNVYRERLYHFNSCRCDADIEKLDIFEKERVSIDYNIIMDDVFSKFGSDNYNKFIDWTEGSTIKELNEKYGVNNCRYVIDKIKDYILQNYTKESLL